MKTIDDVIIVDGIAVLEGIQYQAEANAIRLFLEGHPEIKHAKVTSLDGRLFELTDNGLVKTDKEVFDNPYYIEQEQELELELEPEFVDEYMEEDVEFEMTIEELVSELVDGHMQELNARIEELEVEVAHLKSQIL